mmetsp:Transcript_3684/g.10413  ORF Transcript_3684/g.10413 Transcript_3684/m.10413 type:complete len:361 (-) Transcript_3684:785-1867(-)
MQRKRCRIEYHPKILCCSQPQNGITNEQRVLLLSQLIFSLRTYLSSDSSTDHNSIRNFIEAHNTKGTTELQSSVSNLYTAFLYHILTYPFQNETMESAISYLQSLVADASDDNGKRETKQDEAEVPECSVDVTQITENPCTADMDIERQDMVPACNHHANRKGKKSKKKIKDARASASRIPAFVGLVKTKSLEMASRFSLFQSYSEITTPYNMEKAGSNVSKKTAPADEDDDDDKDGELVLPVLRIPLSATDRAMIETNKIKASTPATIKTRLDRINESLPLAMLPLPLVLPLPLPLELELLPASLRVREPVDRLPAGTRIRPGGVSGAVASSSASLLWLSVSVSFLCFFFFFFSGVVYS